jgi:hypothetical protein
MGDLAPWPILARDSTSSDLCGHGGTILLVHIKLGNDQYLSHTAGFLHNSPYQLDKDLLH